MPVTTRKRKAPEPQIQQPVLPNATSKYKANPKAGVQYKDDDPFEAAFDALNNTSSDSESEVSDFGRQRGRSSKKGKKRSRTKKRRKFRTTGPCPAPELPDLSEHDLDEDEDDEAMFSNHRTTLTPATVLSTERPSIIRLDVGGNTTINLNIADLLRQSGNRLNPESPLAGPPSASRKPPNGFSEDNNLLIRLPAEIRNRVYRMVLVTDAPIIFHKRDNFRRSGQFLRTCRKIAAEGTDVMYGENSFHFERTAERRGKFWEKTWKEVGYKDVRRFLETIGTANISKLKYLSFVLEDGAPYLNPDVEMAERRFVNDPVLQHVFSLISANARLSRFEVVFSGRAQVQSTDYYFLKTLSGIKAPTVKFPKIGYPANKVEDFVLNKLEPIMNIADPDSAEIDEIKVKRKVKMHFDKPTKDKYSTFDW